MNAPDPVSRRPGPASSAEGGYVHAAETFGAADGPGLRYVLFTTGCKMRCLYCHNPDTWTLKSGTWRATTDIVADIGRYVAFYRRTGGLTISGGEPLVQPEFVGEILRRVKEDFGLHTALDTNGALAGPLPDAWFDPVDLVLLDIKHMDPTRHKELTGLELAPVLGFARRLAALGKPAWLRYVLVPGWTDDADDVERLGEFAAGLGNIERADILPFHQLGEAKWTRLRRRYRLAGVPPPEPALVERVKRQLQAHALPVAA